MKRRVENITLIVIALVLVAAFFVSRPDNIFNRDWEQLLSGQGPLTGQEIEKRLGPPDQRRQYDGRDYWHYDNEIGLVFSRDRQGQLRLQQVIDYHHKSRQYSDQDIYNRLYFANQLVANQADQPGQDQVFLQALEEGVNRSIISFPNGTSGHGQTTNILESPHLKLMVNSRQAQLLDKRTKVVYLLRPDYVDSGGEIFSYQDLHKRLTGLN
ncbi:hypothetical protein AWM75_07695 [Aerococcus urinaehominis]|uniref:Uncharacterized protein n=1 Tax=Aerococcus urinaehominis TaxID=128944 RepID=A0A0X8FM65_9LACT|nr:hypothetical protein [Aerococcus urinaehominis]AMB99855.1 hypothetical protein AWM75_07695 [Aerococcus urinaehominis]SDM64326.1 hypothetical protein SAMN04487985_1371 [Aerococcus urinaehominis]